MIQKQKNMLWGIILALVATAVLLFFSPLGNFLRGDIFGQDTIAQEKGLYLGYKTTNASGSILKAGTGTVLETDGIIYGSGSLVYVDLYTVTGSGSLQSNSYNAVLNYDPTLLRAELGNIETSPAVTMDPFVSEVLKTNNIETGTIRLQLNSTTSFSQPRQKLARIGFAVQNRKVKTDVKVNTVRFLTAPTLAHTGEFFLTENGTEPNLASRSLPVETSGLIIIKETINTTNSGTVIKETHTNPDDSTYIKETWQERDKDGNIINHTLETYKDPQGNIIKTVHTIEYPDGSKTIIETYPDGSSTETRYRPDGTIKEIIKKSPDGTIEHWWYDEQQREIRYEKLSPNGDVYIRTKTYDDQGTTVEEWWYQNDKLIKHKITYPDGGVLVEDYVYNEDGSYTVNSVYTDKDGRQIITERKYNKDNQLLSTKIIKDEITLSDQKVLTSGEIVVTIPAKATLKQVESTLKREEPSLYPTPQDKSIGAGIYTIDLLNKNDGSEVKQFFLPAEVKFIIGNEVLNKPGKTLAEVLPVIFDEQTNQWKVIPLADIVARDGGSITFRTLRPGTFTLLVRYTDTPPVSIASFQPSGHGGGYEIYPPITYKGAGGTGTTKPKPGTSCTPATPFIDIKGHWGESYIEEARKACIIDGKRPGRFEPNSFITRAELTKIVVNAFKKELLTDLKVKPFVDVQLKDWFATVVATAKAEKMIGGYPDRTFKPNISINRAEALKIIVEATKAPLSIPRATQFLDVPVTMWFSKYVEYGQSFLKGYTENGQKLFKAGNPITRAEAIKIIMEVIKKQS